MRHSRCVIYTIEKGVFVQVKILVIYDVFIIILTTCFGLQNGSCSDHKIYTRGYYTV